MAVLAVPFGISMGNSGKFVLDVFWKTILLAFLIIASCRTARDLYAYAWSYVIGALVLSYFALFFFDLQRYGTDFSYARLSGLATWDANDVVLVLMPALACALLVYQVAKPRGRMVALLALVGIGATVARSGSRGGLIGLVAVGVALLLFGRGVSFGKRIVTIVVVAAGLSVWAPQGYWQQMQSILNPKADYNYTSKDGRKEVAKRGMGYMLSRPIFGLGINNFEKAECTISEKARNTPAGWGIRCLPPHNSFVQAGAELGVPGLLLWASIPLFGIYALLRLGRRLPYRWRRGTREERFLRLACPYFAVALVGFTATCFFLNFAWLEPYYVLAAFVAALMGVIARRVKEQRMELHAAALAGSSLRQEAAAIIEPVPVLPGQARYPRPLVMLPTVAPPARRPQFVVSGTIVVTDADERAALAATRSLGRAGWRIVAVRHRADLARGPVALLRQVGQQYPMRCVSRPRSPSAWCRSRPRKRPATSSRSARRPSWRILPDRERFPPGAIPWPGLAGGARHLRQAAGARGGTRLWYRRAATGGAGWPARIASTPRSQLAGRGEARPLREPGRRRGREVQRAACDLARRAGAGHRRLLGRSISPVAAGTGRSAPASGSSCWSGMVSCAPRSPIAACAKSHPQAA